jgi:hypothetical protein
MIMLNIIFNRGTKDIENENYVFSPDTYFKYNYEDEWFEDELVKEMVLDVDSSVVESAHAINSPVLGIIAQGNRDKIRILVDEARNL